MANIVVLTPENRICKMCFNGQLFYRFDDYNQTVEVNRAVGLVKNVDYAQLMINNDL